MTPTGSSAGRASRVAAEVVLLGPQRPRPNCPEVLEEVAPGDGPVVVLRAGWRHDETDDEAVRRILGPQTQVLPLYGWFDIVEREVPEIQAAYRARQDALIAIKRLHRRRLGPALQAVRDLRQSQDGPHGREALALAIEDLRRIDAQLLEANDAVHRAHPGVTEPWTQFPLVAHLRDLVKIGGYLPVVEEFDDEFERSPGFGRRGDRVAAFGLVTIGSSQAHVQVLASTKLERLRGGDEVALHTGRLHLDAGESRGLPRESGPCGRENRIVSHRCSVARARDRRTCGSP